MKNIEFVNEETFRKKVSTIKGVYFKGKTAMIEEQAKPAFESTEVIVEDNDGSDLSPSMQATLNTLARINKANNLSRPS